MKTIVRNEDGISIYLLDAETEVEMLENQIIVGSPIEFIIIDYNSENAAVYEDVTAPDDWVGWKYTFDGKKWSENPDYVPFVSPTE
jgi:hypothetical protein